MRRAITVVALILGATLLLSPKVASAAVCAVPSGPFPTIQSAIDDPTCGEITVAAGTYVERLTIARTLALEGAGADLTIVQAPGALTAPKAIVRITGAATSAKIEGFTIQGPGDTNCDSLRAGVRVDGGATGMIHDNRIRAIRDNPLGGCQNGVAVRVGLASEGQVGHAEVSHNRIEDYQKGGIVVSGSGSTATVADNDVQGSGFRTSPLAAQNGIQVSGGAVAEVRQNRVADNKYDPTIAASGGLLIFVAGSGVHAFGNRVSGNDVGVWVIGTQETLVEHNVATGSTFDGIALDNQNVFGATSTHNNVVQDNEVSGNGDGIGLFSANSNLVERNRARANSGPGILVSSEFDFTALPSLQPSSHENILRGNGVEENGGVGIFDDSLGAGTSGTANTYEANRCRQNAGGDSSPAGLCR